MPSLCYRLCCCWRNPLFIIQYTFNLNGISWFECWIALCHAAQPYLWLQTTVLVLQYDNLFQVLQPCKNSFRQMWMCFWQYPPLSDQVWPTGLCSWKAGWPFAGLRRGEQQAAAPNGALHLISTPCIPAGGWRPALLYQVLGSGYGIDFQRISSRSFCPTEPWHSRPFLTHAEMVERFGCSRGIWRFIMRDFLSQFLYSVAVFY